MLFRNSTPLAFPTRDDPMSIATDARYNVIGACLNQIQDGEIRPLSFFSRKLSPTESRYSTFDKELLAVFAAVKKWRDIISTNNTTVLTDHKPIIGAFKSNKSRLSDRQQRHLSFISKFWYVRSLATYSNLS